MRVKLSRSRNWCVGESAKPVFFLSVWWRGRAGKSLKASWAACWAKGRRDICSPGHCGSSCPWLLGVVCFSRLESELHKPWAFRTEGHSTENEEEWQNFTLKSLPGQDILALHHMCQKDTWSHILWSSNQLFSIHCITRRKKLSDAVLRSLKADLLSIFPSASFFLLHPVLTAYTQQQCCPEARIYLSLYGVAAAAARQGRTSGCIPSRALDVGAITLKALGAASSTP